MKAKRLGGTALGLALLAAGCILPDEMAQTQKDVSDVQQQLLRLQGEQDEALARLQGLVEESLQSQEPVTREDLAEIGLRVEQLSRKVSATDERVNDLQQLIDRNSQDLRQAREQARRGPPVPAYPPAETPDPSGGPLGDGSIERMPQAQPSRGNGEPLPDPEALYNTAYADFSKGNLPLAISGFEEYRERFGESPLADNALYWVGECHFSQGDYTEAVQTFDRLLSLYPDSDKAAAGNLKKALAYLEQNKVREAMVQLEYVVSRYPETDEARIAADKLASLRTAPG